jgi:hypothetical protein
MKSHNNCLKEPVNTPITLTGPGKEERMTRRVQQFAYEMNMTSDDFIGEMRKRGCSEPTAFKIWLGLYEEFMEFSDNDLFLSNLRKAADVLKVPTGTLLSK